MVIRVNAKSTKAEILEAFDALKKEKTALEAEIRKLNKESQLESKTAAITSGKKEQDDQQMSQVKALKNSINGTIENLKNLQVGFGSAVSDLSEQLIAESSTLQEIQALVEEEERELQELHDLEAIDENTLDNLIYSYRETSKNFDDEFEN